MIRFIEVLNKTDFNPRMERTAIPRFTLNEVWINEEYVVNVREASGYRSLLKEGALPANLDEDHRFTMVTVNSGGSTATHVVVGSPQAVATKLGTSGASLLKG